MQFGGYNVERAASYGYDVRTDAAGWQYAVPTGTPAGSMVDATPKFNPKTGALVAAGTSVSALSVTPQNTVYGNCGSSTLTLYTKTSGYTSYALNGTLGAAIYHTWIISMSASTGNQLVDRSGVPPIPGVSLNWGTNFSYNVHASQQTNVHGTVSTGVVDTTLGVC
jgi:hypothetical protein